MTEKSFLSSSVPDGLYTLEYSRHSEKHGKFPFHVGPLERTIERNLSDWQNNNTGENVWMVLYIGTLAECTGLGDALWKRSRKERDLKKSRTNP